MHRREIQEQLFQDAINNSLDLFIKTFVSNIKCEKNKENIKKYLSYIPLEIPNREDVIKLLAFNFTLQMMYFVLKRQNESFFEIIDMIEDKKLKEYLDIALDKIKAEDEVYN